MGKTLGIENSAFHGISNQFANLALAAAAYDPMMATLAKGNAATAQSGAANAAMEQMKRDQERDKRKKLGEKFGPVGALISGGDPVQGLLNSVGTAAEVGMAIGTGGATAPSLIDNFLPDKKPSGIGIPSEGIAMSNLNTGGQLMLAGGAAKATPELPAGPAQAVTPAVSSLDVGGQLVTGGAKAAQGGGDFFSKAGNIIAENPEAFGAAGGALALTGWNRMQENKAQATEQNNMIGTGAAGAQRNMAERFGSVGQSLIDDPTVPTIDTMDPQSIRTLDPVQAEKVLQKSQALGKRADLRQSRALRPELRAQFSDVSADVSKANRRAVMGAIGGLLLGPTVIKELFPMEDTGLEDEEEQTSNQSDLIGSLMQRLDKLERGI